jgi:hypothetical protein
VGLRENLDTAELSTRATLTVTFFTFYERFFHTIGR